MRMWTGVKTYTMCDKHLLEEHNDILKIVEHIRAKKNIRKWVTTNYLEPPQVAFRHMELYVELNDRGLKFDRMSLGFSRWEEILEEYPYTEYLKAKINQDKARKALHKLCKDCKKRHKEHEGKIDGERSADLPDLPEVEPVTTGTISIAGGEARYQIRMEEEH